MAILITPDADTPQGLIDALYYTHAMSTPEGMDLLLRDHDVDPAGCTRSWLGDSNPADIAGATE